MLGARPLVDTLLVGGRTVVEDGRLTTADEETIARELAAASRRHAGGGRMTVETPVKGGIGESIRRPDGIPKVKGEFAYSSDLWADGMLWGATLRSPHPRARIREIDIAPALAIRGVHAVLTHEDVPGRKVYGLEIADQPVLAWDQVRYQGEPVAIVAADHPETARHAAATDRGRLRGARAGHRSREGVRRRPAAPVRQPAAPRPHRARRPATRPPRSWSAASTRSACRTRRSSGRSRASRCPAEDGGVDLFVSTQWLHVDRDQVAASLDLPPEKVRITLGGVGGAFGGREDLSMQVHACLLALHTGKPVKMMYGREESFFGHIHRHPARMRYEHGATRDGRLVYVKCRILLDGGAYASSSTAVCSNAASFACGPYDVPNALIDCLRRLHRQPAVRRDARLRRRADLLRARGADGQAGGRARAGPGRAAAPQRAGRGRASSRPGATIRCPAPVDELLASVSARPLPGPSELLPGGVSNTTHGEGVRRGVGYAVGYKNVGYSEGFDDYSTARVRLSLVHGEPLVEVHTAACEVGQGLVTVQEQIARHELGVERVIVLPADTQVGSAGSSSASRQTYMTGGAVKLACEAVREELERRGSATSSSCRDEPIDITREHHHRQTFPLDEKGQGDAHVTFAFAAHRAVVDVDTELGLVRVVEIATAQDVGRAINPQAVEGQIEGGIAQGLGLALMEEIQVVDGEVRNASFTDYLIPTVLDMPPVELDVLELADPGAPYGLRGVGEPPTISSTPAIVAALRAATGAELPRVPVRPDHIVGV